MKEKSMKLSPSILIMLKRSTRTIMDMQTLIFTTLVAMLGCKDYWTSTNSLALYVSITTQMGIGQSMEFHNGRAFLINTPWVCPLPSSS